MLTEVTYLRKGKLILRHGPNDACYQTKMYNLSSSLNSREAYDNLLDACHMQT